MDKLDELLREVSTYQEQETTTEGSYSMNDSQFTDNSYEQGEIEAAVVREFLKRESFKN